MTIEYLKEHGSIRMGAGEYIKEGKKWIFKSIDGIKIWKCENRYYWVENDNVSIIYNSVLDK